MRKKKTWKFVCYVMAEILKSEDFLFIFKQQDKIKQ